MRRGEGGFWRGLWRLIGTVFTAASAFCLILDVLAYTARSPTVLRPLGAVWLLAEPESINAIHTSLYVNDMPWMWDGAIRPVLSQSGFIVFGCLALFFLALAWLVPRRRRRRRIDDDPRYDRRSH